MTQRKRETQTVDEAEVPERWIELVEQVDRRASRVVVKRDGKVVAAIISALDWELFQQNERRRAELWKVVEEIRARNADKDPEEVERDVAEAIEEMRAERRAQAAAQSST